MTIAVGIDIAAKTFDMVIRRSGKPSKPSTFKQTPAGHAAVIKQLKKLKPRSIVMEATGIYYLDLAVAIAEGLPVASSIRRASAISAHSSSMAPKPMV